MDACFIKVAFPGHIFESAVDKNHNPILHFT